MVNKFSYSLPMIVKKLMDLQFIYIYSKTKVNCDFCIGKSLKV